ncbi:MAG: peptidoglycan DD-metalloendopeptidase family protein [Bacteroidia bacterium]|nr:peptidoglycan DD-metalloendopeptidase family protein [Bacteroidia bacterium]
MAFIFRNSSRRLILSMILAVVTMSAFSQSREEMEQKKKKAREEIEYTSKLLDQTKQSKQTSVSKLMILKKQIRSRTELINNINNEINLTSAEIDIKKEEISKLEAELKMLKDEYARMIYYAYKNRSSYDRWMFILSSKDFNQAYRRLKYLQQYSQYRKKQVTLIQETQQDLNNQLTTLEQKINEKKDLAGQKESEKGKLAFEQTEQSKVVDKLKLKEKELKSELKEKERIAQKIQNAIDDIIAEEAHKTAAAAKKSNTTNKTVSSTAFTLTPEDKIISNNFGNNKGRFPWPTERGIIINSFGEHPHPVLPGIKVNNNGVDINTTEGSKVRAVFEGEVRSVITIQGANQAVIIRHGNYLTVYQNLREVLVKKGDKVKAKQVIGTVYTDYNDNNKSVVHFEIWNETRKENPENWLSKN